LVKVPLGYIHFGKRSPEIYTFRENFPWDLYIWGKDPLGYIHLDKRSLGIYTFGVTVAYRPQKRMELSHISPGFTIWWSVSFSCASHILQGK